MDMTTLEMMQRKTNSAESSLNRMTATASELQSQADIYDKQICEARDQCNILVNTIQRKLSGNPNRQNQ